MGAPKPEKAAGARAINARLLTPQELHLPRRTRTTVRSFKRTFRLRRVLGLAHKTAQIAQGSCRLQDEQTRSVSRPPHSFFCTSCAILLAIRVDKKQRWRKHHEAANLVQEDSTGPPLQRTLKSTDIHETIWRKPWHRTLEAHFGGRPPPRPHPALQVRKELDTRDSMPTMLERLPLAGQHQGAHREDVEDTKDTASMTYRVHSRRLPKGLRAKRNLDRTQQPPEDRHENNIACHAPGCRV